MNNIMGKHLVVEAQGCDKYILNDKDAIKEVLFDITKKSKLTVIGEIFYEFSPHGITGILLLSESHLSIHTWPEKGYAAIDCFSCNLDMNSEEIVAILNSKLSSKKINHQIIYRGYKNEEYRNLSKSWSL